MKQLLSIMMLVLILWSCVATSQEDLQLDTVVIEDCVGKKMELFLPVGYIKGKREYYEEGFYESYSYADNSVIVLLCGGNAELNFSKLSTADSYTRKEVIAGHTIMYEHVSKKRKQAFDIAFDKMMKP